MGEFTNNYDRAKCLAFSNLRDTVNHQSCIDLAKRLKTNPTPTEEERRLGIYIEELESPVRDAVMLMRNKGYNTIWSGFGIGTRDPGYQAIKIYDRFNLDSKTIEELAKLGAKIGRWDREIEFSVTEPSIEIIKAMWDKIAEILPDLGHIAEQASSSSSSEEHFQRILKNAGAIEYNANQYLSGKK